MVRLGQAEGGAHLAGQQLFAVAGILLRRRELLEHQHEGIVADDGMLVLQVVEQAEPLGSQMLADYRHVQVGPALAAHGFRPGVA